MDEDSDGVVKVDHIMKVIELLGTVDAKLPAKEIRQIVDMLAKEDLLQVEENIEQSMALHSETDDSFRIDAAYDQDLTDLEAAASGLGYDSFADAVAAYNEQYGTNYTTETAKEALGQ